MTTKKVTAKAKPRKIPPGKGFGSQAEMLEWLTTRESNEVRHLGTRYRVVKSGANANLQVYGRYDWEGADGRLPLVLAAFAQCERAVTPRGDSYDRLLKRIGDRVCVGGEIRQLVDLLREDIVMGTAQKAAPKAKLVVKRRAA